MADADHSDHQNAPKASTSNAALEDGEVASELAGKSDAAVSNSLKRKQPEASASKSGSSSPVQRTRPFAALSASSQSPPLNYDDVEEQPPLPDEPPPQAAPSDDGWEAIWEPNAGTYYYFNRFTQATQWENPRVPEATAGGTAHIERPPGTSAAPSHISYINNATGVDIHPAVANGYNPAIHGDYDPNADYAQFGKQEADNSVVPSDAIAAAPGTAAYEAVGKFNRFTGRFQHESLTPDNFNDDNKAKRQLSAFYNVDEAANSHNGKSLKAERSGKKLSAKEIKEFKEKRKARKEEKRRAWLRD